jgi:hypothetical protein
MEISVGFAIFLFIFAGIGLFVVGAILVVLLNVDSKPAVERKINYVDLNPDFIKSCKDLGKYLFNIDEEKIVVRGIDNSNDQESVVKPHISGLGYFYAHNLYTIELIYQNKVEDKEDKLLSFYVAKKDIVKY